MYSNIPTGELVNLITCIAINNHINEEIIKEIKILPEHTIKQNYFEQNSYLDYIVSDKTITNE
jgi:hypothetical protein